MSKEEPTSCNTSGIQLIVKHIILTDCHILQPEREEILSTTRLFEIPSMYPTSTTDLIK